MLRFILPRMNYALCPLFYIIVELIDDITDHVDTTNTRLIKETRHIKFVDRKSGTCGKLVQKGVT